MEISCAFPSGPHVVDHIVEAERLGYERAWLFDSPALYGDIWVIAALAAQRTSRIALGPAVLVPNLRHPLTQASAIATLEQLAPGRVVVAIGTGFTDRMRRDTLEVLQLIRTDKHPKVTGMPRAEMRVARWVEPRLLAEVAYTEITPDGLIRHPSFKGIREDKDAWSVRLEQA